MTWFPGLLIRDGGVLIDGVTV